MDLPKALILVSQDVIKSIKRLSTILKKETRSGQRKVKERQALPKLVFKMESLNDYLEDMVTSYDLDDSFDYLAILEEPSASDSAESSWENSQDPHVRFTEDDDSDDEDQSDDEAEDVSDSEFARKFVAIYPEGQAPKEADPGRTLVINCRHLRK